MRISFIVAAAMALASGTAPAQGYTPDERFEVTVVDTRDDQALAQPGAPLLDDFLVKKGFKRGKKKDAVTIRITEKQSQESRFATIIPYVHGKSPKQKVASLIYLEKGSEREVHGGIFELEESPLVKGQKVEPIRKPKVKDYHVKDGQVVEATGFSWECFLNELITGCGLGAINCMGSGPAWPYCILMYCGTWAALAIWKCW